MEAVMKKLLVGAAALLTLASPALADAGGRFLQVVAPNQSIQAAIDRAAEGGWIFVLPGTYRETADATNGLNITRGLHLVGLSTARKKVVLENSGSQRNGIVAVPAAHTDCMSCHSSLAPPFDLLPGAETAPLSSEPAIYDLSISGITIKDFGNNGLFARNLDGFKFIDVHSVNNPNYGIFPTESRNGLISHSSATGANDSGIWVETSYLVAATHNLVEGNVNGFEVSNSEEITLANNEVRGNTIGMAILFLPDIFDVRPDSRRIRMLNNHIHDNNKANTARPGSILSTVPSGIGILHLGVDDSMISKNTVEHHDFVGIAIADYCAVVAGGPFDCAVDPDISPGFLLDQSARNNQVIENLLLDNGNQVDPGNPFAFAASDLALITLDDNANCYQDNLFTTFFSTLGVLPGCR
jgi:parallel beta-helix repeat protein